MTGTTSSHLSILRRLLSAGIIGCALVVFFVWLATRETAAEKEISRLLAELRAAGEPIDAQDLARLFPDPSPEEDAAILFSGAFNIATNNSSPGSTPFIMSGSVARTEVINDFTLQQLIAFCAATAGITNALPKVVPPNARFAMHWNKGITNYSMIGFVRLRQLIQLIGTHVLTAAESGDAEQAVRMIEHGFALTRTINYEGLLVSHMIRHASEGLMCTVTERALNRIQFTDAQLRRIASALGSETTDDFRNCLRAEHCYGICAFQAVRAGMPVEVLFGGPVNPPWWKRLWKRLSRRQPAYRDSDFLAYLKGIPARLRLSTMPPMTAIRGVDNLTQQYAEQAASEIGEGIFPSGIRKAMKVHAESQARLASLAVVLAVERARLAQHGQLPLSLDALVPQYLPFIPQDPFDGRLRFKKLPRGYVVYSIGADGVDDGGTERLNWNVQTNYDVTIIIER